MNEPSVTESPVEPEREEKAVAELEPGTWVEVIDKDGDWIGEARVLHVETYDDGDLGRRALLLYGMPGFVPDSLRCEADMTLPLLTEEQIADQMEAERREQIAARFDRLADLFRQTTTPLPCAWRPIKVTVEYDDHIEQVGVVAKALGLDVTEHGPTVGAVLGDALDHSASVVVEFFGSRPKAPESLIPAPVATHYETNAWKGDGPGTCGIECACGVTYDGFDSLAEAKQQLAWHIADPSGQDYGRADDGADDPTPVSPARVPAAVGVAESHITDKGVRLDDETPVPTGLDEVPDEQLRETVHWATSLLPVVIACGAAAGPFAHRDREKVTCAACIETWKDPS